MHPPQHICRDLARVSSSFRIGWMGRDPVDDDELNPGSFALVQLRERDDIGRVEDPLKTLSTDWDIVPLFNEFDQPAGLKRITRGPLFNAEGGLERDWDVDKVRPIVKQVFDEDLGFTPGDIFSGRFLIVARMFAIEGAIYKARYQAAVDKGKESEQRVSDLVGEMGDFIWHEATKTDQASVDMAWKHAKQNLPQRYIAHKERDAYRFDHGALDRLGYK